MTVMRGLSSLNMANMQLDSPLKRARMQTNDEIYATSFTRLLPTTKRPPLRRSHMQVVQGIFRLLLGVVNPGFDWRLGAFARRLRPSRR